MAAPRVFVSSTCFDLGEIRDNLVSFIQQYGYDSVLSDRGDVFYHPDFHTHESCINEIQNCDLFVLIIGGRFGGEYVIEPDKSIVNAEYYAAKKLGIPVFAFVKNDVWSNHRVFHENKKNPAVYGKIKFPAIEKQAHAEKIFNFIDEVRKSPVNNGFFTFEFARDIQDLLKKQWAGMFYEFLSKRQRESEIKITNDLISNLTLASKKTEELIENIFKHLEPSVADSVIGELDKVNRAREFFNEIFRHFDMKGFVAKSIKQLIKIDTDVSWDTFLVDTNDFYHLDFTDSSGIFSINLVSHLSDRYLTVGGEELDIVETERHKYDKFTKMYSFYKSLSLEQKAKVLESFAGGADIVFAG